MTALTARTMPKTYAKTDPEFGPRMAQMRKDAGYTQTELAKHLGITRRMVAYYESENHYPPADHLAPIAEALNVTIPQLLGQDTKGTKKKPHGNSRISRSLKLVEQLPKRDQQTVCQLIDALVAANKSKA